MAALEHREPDRVPTMFLLAEYASVHELLGKKPFPMGNLFKNPLISKIIDRTYPLMNKMDMMGKEIERFTYLITASAVKSGADSVWLAYAPMWRFCSSKQAVDYYGRLWDLVDDGHGNMGAPMYNSGLIKSPDDWKAWDKKYLLGVPEKANRYFKKILKDFGDKIFLFIGVGSGLFENTWQSMGFERFSVAIRKEKDLVRRMIKFYEDLCCVCIEAIADAGIPAYCYGEDLSFRSGPMLNPRVFEELFGDSLRRITETAHSLGMKIIIHSCGNTYKLLDWFADCGFDGVHPLEPTAGMELAKVKEMVGDRICPIGNIDVTHILVDGTREEVYEAVKQAIHDAGPGGGYILAPNHSHSTVSVQRLLWMLEAAKEYGRYPLQV